MSLYPKTPYEVGRDSTVLQCNRVSDKNVAVKPDLPGNVILIHGVNDVGTTYASVEQGLCAGLGERLDYRERFHSAAYRMPRTDDEGKLEIDPDAVFFKRQLKEGHHTPVIPFYWGFRAAQGNYKTGAETEHGQAADRYGNRLDKDLSKGGGPFANATSTLVDMWNKGFGSGPRDLADRAASDPLRPVLEAPGRMYMVLAAQRLAALIAMMRDYDPNEAVSLVAHSQGCMLSLLAQAFLMQRGLRPADTLVLTHPPYSLVEDVPWLNHAAEWLSGGKDALMDGHYSHINARQTLHARLQTLVNIVQEVAAKKQAAPALAALKEPQYHGIVGCGWQADQDRDNRGKVYLYFCPEDMTVALDNIQGIGWQGVPDYVAGSRVAAVEKKDILGFRHQTTESQESPKPREALKEMGKSFFQRVFTAKPRVQVGASAKGPQPVLIGAAPYDFILRLEGEDDHAHVAKGSASLRAHSPEVAYPVKTKYLGVLPKPEVQQREGIRRITGELLATPVKADLYAGAVTLPGDPKGAYESVDPIDAAISVTSRYGLQDVWQLIDDQPGASTAPVGAWHTSPNAAAYADVVAPVAGREPFADAAINAGKAASSQRRQIQMVYACCRRPGPYLNPQPIGKLLVLARESADEARLRQQHSTAPRSFHGAIFGSAANHQHVTAYDIAIGGGKASTDPNFYAYLCAVADWRLKKPAGAECVFRRR